MDNVEILINSAAAYIYKTFVVSIRQANEHARGHADLIQAKSGDINTVSQVQLQELVTKALAKTYEWRDKAAQQQYLRDQQSKIDGYNAYLETARKSPFKKW